MGSLFREVNRISISTAILGVITIVVSYIANLIEDPVTAVGVMVIAVVVFALFLHSLLRDKISQLERDKNASTG